jgi:hypothetical protein
MYNNKLLEAIGTTLYFINYRRHLNLFIKQFPSIKVEVAIVTAIEIK